MSTDLEQRVRAAVRDLAGTVPVAQPPAAAIRQRVPHRPASGPVAGRWLAPVLAGAAVLTLVAVVAVVPGWSGWSGLPSTSEPAGAGAQPVLPERFAGTSGRTASVAGSPPGPAIATFTRRSGGGAEVLVVVGVDGQTYRQLDPGSLYELSHGRASSVRDPVLSPDGSQLAGAGGYVIDLRTGTGEWFPVLPGDTENSWTAATLLGWSPDGRHLGYEVPGGVAVLDLDRGESQVIEVAISDHPAGLAFAPDGREIAVATGAGEQVVIFDRSGERLRELDLLPSQRLAGRGTGWSPDGAVLVVQDGAAGLGLLDPTGAGVELPEQPSWSPASRVELLGWRSPRTMLVGVWSDGGSGQDTAIVEVATDRMNWRSWLPDAGEPAASLHLASGLLADAEIRDTGRGSLPVAVWAAVALLAAAGLLALVAAARRRLRSRAV